MLYISDLPYLEAKPRVVYLPQGDPLKIGNVVFVMANNFDSVVKSINNTRVKHNNKYYYYYYNMAYIGQINYRRFRIYKKDKRKDLYGKIHGLTPLAPHPFKPLNGMNYRNTYFDMHTYMQIYNKLVGDLAAQKQSKFFWDYIKGIVSQSEGFTNKYIMINVDDYPLKGNKISEKMKNPLYNILYTMQYKPENFSDMDIDFIMYSSERVLRFNPNKIGDKTYNDYRREINKLWKDPVEITKEDKSNIIADKVKEVMGEKSNFIGDDIVTDEDDIEDVDIPDEDDDIVDEINKKAIDTIDIAEEILDDDEIDSTIIGEKILADEINNDKELIGKIYSQITKEVDKNKSSTSARDLELRKKQKELKVRDMTLEDLDKIKSNEVKIPETDISKQVNTLNKNMHKVKFSNFEKSYNENLLEKDIIGCFTTLNDKSIPMSIISINIKDSSDPLNYKDTYTVVLEDSNRVRHSITVDIPKFYEDKFLYLGGNKKIINKQNFLYPIVKTGPDTVQIVTNYNKAFIRRVDTKSLSDVEKLKKLIKKSDDVNKYFVFGYATTITDEYATSVEYDELGKFITKFKKGDTTIYFNQATVKEVASDKNIKIPDDKFIVGFIKDEPIFIDKSTHRTDDGLSIVNLMVSKLSDEHKDIYHSIKDSKSLSYTSITIMAQQIPLVNLLSFWVGFEKVLTEANINWRLEPRRYSSVNDNEYVLKFADCSFVYDKSTKAQILLNGLGTLPLNEINFADMNDKEVYIRYFIKVYGRANIVSALMNFYEFMIDHITKSVLEDLNLPTDIVSVMLYANELLVDNGYTKEVKETLYRIRSNEVVPAILYATIAKEYITVKNSAGKKKISLQKDAVIKQLLALQTVEDYSVLNPAVEVGKFSNVTAKGWRGANVPEAYNEVKRSYDVSMLGVLGMSTSPDANIGVMRSMVMEPTISSARGYIDHKYQDPKKLKDTELFSMVELMTSNSATKDDATRTAMAAKQTKHVIPTVSSSPVLISNGLEETVRFHLSSDFAANADEDGEVIDINDKHKILVVKYKSGKTRAIDLSNHIVKNGAGGFYLPNELVSDLKVGDKFKKGDVLAMHKNFFSKNSFNGTRMNVGPLVKVACMSSYNTYEDTGFITEAVSEKLATEMVFKTTVVIGKNATVDYISHLNEKVSIGDPLVVFDTSFGESEVNKFLSGLSEENKAIVNEHGKTNIKSKYAGVISDIKMFSTVEIDELSPTLQTIVKDYYKKVEAKRNYLNKFSDKESINKAGILYTESIEPVKPNQYGVLRGEKIDEGVLVEIYISYKDVMGVGDKGAHFSALKFVVGEIVPNGYEPYSLYRPDEPIGTMFANNGVLKRMTPSVIVNMFGNKCIVEHKRKLKEIFFS